MGFRSTRIRTPDNSLISIPNNSVVNTTVENLSLRPQRRQKFLVQVTYDTTREKLDTLLEGIRQILREHPFANGANSRVRFNDFGESSLNILVIFHLMTEDSAQELEISRGHPAADHGYRRRKWASNSPSPRGHCLSKVSRLRGRSISSKWKKTARSILSV